MVRRHRTPNAWESTINDSGGISAGDTTVTVTDASDLPTEGDFFLLMEEEIVKVTARSSNTLTIVRAQDGTSADAHADGSTIKTVACKSDFYEIAKDNGQVKALPYGRIQVWDGTTLTNLTASNFTLRNTGTGTAVSDGNDGTIVVQSKDMSGNDISGATYDFGGSNDWRVTCHIGLPVSTTTSPDILHFYMRQSSGGACQGLSLYPGEQVTYSTRTTFISGPSIVASHGVQGIRDIWFRVTIEWNFSGSDERYTWYYSIDGVHWWQLGQDSFAGSTAQLGVWLTNITGSVAYMRANIYSFFAEPL